MGAVPPAERRAFSAGACSRGEDGDCLTLTDRVETSKKLIREVITKQPVTKVVLVETKKPSCDPNYTGACVPIASDVDCAGGSGNGPAYVEGPCTSSVRTSTA